MRRFAKVFIALVAATLLSGCYVYALTPPASDEPAINHSLAGSWYVLDQRGKPNGILLHFILSKTGGPMRVVATESGEYGVFEFYTLWTGDKNVFAIRKLPGAAAGSMKIMAADNTKFLLGTYRIQNDDTLLVYTYDTAKMRAAIAAGAIRGRVAHGHSPPALLTGTPQDVFRALATPEAQAAVSSEPFPIARRVNLPR